MNKTAIKNFAVWARQKLIADITYKAGTIGITENGVSEKLPQSTNDLYFFDIGTKDYAEVSGDEIKQRNAFVDAIRKKEQGTSTFKEAFENVIEEVAYTWFNRLIAIRFMEVNDYLPSRVRVLSSENKAKLEPDFVTNPFDTDLEFTPYEKDRIIQFKDENKLDELFRMLFIKQCNKLNEILPELFEKTDDYTELLLTISFTDKDGIVYKLTHDIDENDFNVEKEGQVEIIGWMYQYYISKKHDEIVNIYKGTVKKADIPAATQLFTTDWVVRYMVDNSLGRYWIERNPKSKLIEKLAFFVTPKDGKINYVDDKVYPADLTFFDPCMGSGHILVYAFDVLMEIYRECGYSDRDASLNIVQHNLFGLDIDKRAYQLAYFAVMMKARSYNRRALTQNTTNNLAYIEESNAISKFTNDSLTTDKEQNKIGEYLVEAFKHAQEIGSLQTIEKKDYKEFFEYLLNLDSPKTQIDLFSSEWLLNTKPLMLQLTKQAYIMSNKYAVVCTNPPYMNKLEGHLKKFVVDNYKDYSGDLFSAFMYRNFGFCKTDGYSAFMTPFVWMFIKTYEKLREYIISNKTITSLVQMEYSAFEEATVPICSFILKNSKRNEKSLCFKLSDFKGGMEVQKQKVLEAIANKDCGYFYEADENNFSKIPSSPIAYWISLNLIKIFSNKLFYDYTISDGQNKTGNNSKFVRCFWEVKDYCIGKDKKWLFYAKGGGYRKWVGNLIDVVNWSLSAREFYKKDYVCRIIPEYLWYKKGITWGLITSNLPSFRILPEEATFDVGGSSIFLKNYNNYNYFLGLLNSNVFLNVVKMLNPTLNFQVKDIRSMPIIIENEKVVNHIVEKAINISKIDWNSFETSWDFKKHPLVPTVNDWNEQINSQFSEGRKEKFSLLEWHFEKWKIECNYRFNQLKENEEELNRIFIDIYGLQDELTPDVEDKDVTVYRIFDTKDDIPESMGNSKYSLTKKDVVKSLISYAVGCMFGRYSLDVDGLAYAGGQWDYSKYSTFIPDADNCVPITDEEYFEDDIVGLFCAWIKKAYGEDNLEENLDFIAKSLGNKGNTSREIIRNYFLNDFIKDHIKTYQKRPIYWLFDSGKQNGFKALCYMHRWNADTIGNMRVEYLHRMQRVYDKEIERMQEIIDNSRDNKEINKATKRKEKLQKQVKETKDYDAKVAHLALSRIDIDLDDGVKVNYEKVQTGKDGNKMQILAKI